jgi:hypothetical protein
MRIFSNLILAALAVTACGSPKPLPNTEDAAPDVEVTPEIDNDGGMQDVAADTNVCNGTMKYGLCIPNMLACAAIARPQQILMLDFRSGWWSGGGGAGFSDIALGSVVSACPSSKKINVDYHHFENQIHIKCLYSNHQGPNTCTNGQPVITVNDILATLEKKNIDDYTQIWILSGSVQDPTNIPTGGDLFQYVLKETKTSCTPMLFGAGDGFDTHLNTLTTNFGWGDIVTQETNPPGFFVGLGATLKTEMKGPQQMKSHIVFQGVTSIADSVEKFGQTCIGDRLKTSSTYEIIGFDTGGRPAIAAGATKLPNEDYRPFLIDVGFQRFYAMDKHPNTLKYLHNIVMYLSQVGCKSTPLPDPK